MFWFSNVLFRTRLKSITQRGDVVAAVAAKYAEAAAVAANDANAEAKALRENATPKQHPKNAKRPDLREDITSRDEKQYIFSKGCNKENLLRGLVAALYHPPFQSEW